MTLFSVFLMAVLSRPSVTTTAIVMTPRTTAYSAIVWPASSLISFMYSFKRLTSGMGGAGAPDADFGIHVWGIEDCVRDFPLWVGARGGPCARKGAEKGRYSVEMTLLSRFLMAVLRRPSVTTTAIV